MNNGMDRQIKIYPFILVKPSCIEHFHLLLRTIDGHQLKIKDAFWNNKCAEISRKIYKKNISQDSGDNFRIGLEGHIKIINWFFGNRSLILFLNSKRGKLSLQKPLARVKKIKKDFRKMMIGGENLRSLFIILNLRYIERDEKVLRNFQKGLVGIEEKNHFVQLSKDKSYWDYYYFKYIHCSDSLDDLREEVGILGEMGLLTREHRLSRKDLKFIEHFHSLPLQTLK